jgi:spermidine synthase
MKVERADERLSLTIELLDDEFLPVSNEDQRVQLVQRVASEALSELVHLDGIAAEFVPSLPVPSYTQDWRSAPAVYTDTELLIDGHQVMQDWEAPVMKAMVARAGATHGDVLEIGFGMGISATYFQELGVRSHTIVEPNDGVIEQFERWRTEYPDRDIRLIQGFWEETVDQLGRYDGVFYDPYPTEPEENVPGETPVRDDPFYAVAASVLRPDGVFSHFTDEIDSLSRPHQRFLLRYFERVEVEIVHGLAPPPGCHYFSADSMAVVSATRPRAVG